jgi:NAD(P)H-hydrate repair Nnr-like enzyme with NAD(P)H-hydrate epimerase domain
MHSRRQGSAVEQMVRKRSCLLCIDLVNPLHNRALTLTCLGKASGTLVQEACLVDAIMGTSIERVVEDPWPSWFGRGWLTGRS